MLDYRLKTYENLLNLNADEAKGAYNWNKAISASFLPALHTLEVKLRNKIYYAAVESHKRYSNEQFWFSILVTEMQNQKIDNMVLKQKKRWINIETGDRIQYSKTEKDLRRYQHKGKSINYIISNLSFGFWTDFCNKKYYKNRYNQNLILWNDDMIKNVFSNYKNIDDFDIKDFFITIERIRKLRNRIAHHEPIWKENYSTTNNPIYGVQPALDILNRKFDEIIEIISWIDRDAHSDILKYKFNGMFKRIIKRKTFNIFLK